jgi:threonine/homoserine/homoserine lactone efflux protein
MTMESLPVHGFLREMSICFRGMIIGFVMAAPIGPVNMLCIQRTLAGGPVSGIVSGLGAASADAFYAGIAAFGLTMVSQFLSAHASWLRITGGLFICFLGCRALFRKPSQDRPAGEDKGSLRSFSSTLFLTLANPTTIFSYGLVLASFGAADVRHDAGTAIFLTLGVFTGSGLWWIMLSAIVGKFRRSLGPAGLGRIIHLSGLIIAGFGVFVLASAFSR